MENDSLSLRAAAALVTELAVLPSFFFLFTGKWFLAVGQGGSSVRRTAVSPRRRTRTGELAQSIGHLELSSLI